MAISESMLNVVSAGINWINENLGTSKKEMQVQIRDLEKEIARLTEGNKELSDNMTLISMAIISHLRNNPGYTISADSITFAGVNNGVIQVDNRKTDNNQGIVAQKSETVIQEEDDDESFFITDEELALARIKKKNS